MINLPIAVIHRKMKIPSFIIVRNADIGGVKYNLAQNAILENITVKKSLFKV